MATKTKLASSIEAGDRVYLEDREEWKRVKAVSPGFFKGSLFFDLGRDDWACVSAKEELVVK